MSSVSDLIHSSFRLIGAIAAGETLETNELNDAFVSLNQMLASWSADGVMVVGRSRQQFLIGGQQAYPLPTNTRPIHIEAASVFQNGADSPLEIVDAAGWESITEKALTSMFCKKLYCDYAYPQATIYIWPLPRFNGAMLELWQYTQVEQFTDVNQTVDLPPGYEMAVRYNFAVALLPEYPRSAPDPSLPAQAQMYKATLAQLNSMHHMSSRMQAPAQALVDQSSSAVS